ncbi:probable fatty acyl-CoA reductase 5 [Cryptomeria japonica]|uniref:probable fatty acyl-CoA reductase 5 n=1 Tax=Cryptomeria japonica TaxID=3369 RepID=UPI0025AD0785|nr:probable fatty acyl-CoA reductase 5 [Cryptomeria japonica]
MGVDMVEFLKDKDILVVGGTGFLGKVFIEKILRVQGDVGHIFTLVRAIDLQSAQAKLEKEVFCSDLFESLRERYRDGYSRFMEQKVIPVVGDVISDDLGMQEKTREELSKRVDIIVNTAATTSFYERYDVALNVNTMGAANVVRFGKSCPKLQILCHVSTAYVNVGRSGIIREEALTSAEAPSKTGGTMPSPWDVECERELIRKTLEEIRTLNSTQDKIEKRQMKELAEQRAREFGWPNAYVFTKAMAEVMVDHLRGDIPVVIVRPSIIESTLSEPFPGWIEGQRMVDPLFIAYGKGQLSRFPAAPNLIVDMIPVDMVANGMISCLRRHASNPGLYIYHLTTSVQNPLLYFTGIKAAYEYFKLNPCKDKKGQKIINIKKAKALHNMEIFRRYMTLHYKIPLQILHVVDLLLCGFKRKQYNRLLRTYNFVMKLAQLYEPFIFFEGRFDNANTRRLWEELSKEDAEKFKFDVKCIEWTDYLYHVHIPGLMKHVSS